MNVRPGRLAPLSVLFALLLPVTAHAATAQFRVLFDVDNVSSTGCTVGGMAGVDRVLETAISYSETSGTVTGVTRRECVNGALGEPIVVSSGGWQLGMQGASGNIVVETSVPAAVFGTPFPYRMRVGFAGAAGNVTDELLTAPNGQPILWPVAQGQGGTGRRRAAGGGSAPLTHSIVLDGQTGDWGAIAPEAVSAATGNTAVRLTKVYALADTETLSFRFDTRVSSSAPVANDDTYTVRQGKTLNVASPGVLINDSDPNKGALTAIKVNGPAHGNLTFYADGGFIYINDGVLVPEDTFEYKANNGSADSNVAKVKINITPNAQPRAVADAYNVPHRGTITIAAPGVLTNDTDGDNDPLRAELTSQPQHGAVTLNANGSFTYTHNGTNTLQDAFSYRVNDGFGNSNATTVTLTIAANIPAVAVADAYTLAEGATLAVAAPGVMGNDTDSDTPAQFRTALLVTGPANGTLTLNTDGSFNYVHNGGETTTDSFTYRVNDGIANSNTVTVTLTITPVNDLPVAVADAYTTNEDTTLTVPAPGVRGNDTDADNATLTVAVGTAPASGTLTLSADGSFVYVPNPNFNGSDSFTYTTSDGTASSAPATVTITLNAVNDAPVNTVAPVTTLEDTSVSLGSPTVSDVDAGSANVTVTLTATNGMLQRVTAVVTLPFPAQPTLTISGTVAEVNAELATVHFIPAANFNGTATVSMVTSDNGNTGTGGAQSDSDTINVTVTAVNDRPSFTAGANQTVLEDSGAQTVTGWATAMSAGPADEAGQTLTFSATSNNTTLFAVQPAIAANGTLTYTPAANMSGLATITVTLADNGGTANSGADTTAPITFTITITDVNDAPSFTAGAAVTVSEDSGAYSANWASAISAGPAPEAAQTVAFNVTNNNNALFSVQPSISPAGLLTFTPAVNANGSATITVTLVDNGGTANGGADTSAPVNVTITITAVNDAPSFTVPAAAPTVNEDAAGVQTVSGFATAIAAGPTADETAGQTVTFNVTNNNNALFSVQPAINAAGDLTYTLAAHASGSAIVTVTATDNGTPAASSAAQTFTINVNAVNDEPSFSGNGNVVVNEDSAASSAAWVTASSAGPGESSQTLSYNTTNDNNALFSVQPAVAADGTLTFTLATNANGSANVSVTVSDNGGTANGGDATGNTVTFTITANAVNDAPSFTKGGNVTVLEDSGAFTQAGWVAASSSGPADEAGQTKSYNLTNDNNALFAVQPAVDANGQLTFTPAAHASGAATVTISISDNGGTANGGVDTSATQTFTITITDVNDEPAFTGGGNVTVNEDSSAYSAPWVASSNAGPGESSQTLSYNTTNNNNALFSVQPAVAADGTLTFTLATNANGSANVSVTVSDNGGTANGGDATGNTVAFTITVTAVNDAPSFAVPASAPGVSEDTAGVQTVTGFATSIAAGPTADETGSQTVSFTVTNDNNTLFSVQPAINAAGDLTYTLAANQSGSATVTVTASDNGVPVATSAAQSFTITVSAVNDAPVNAVPAAQAVNEDAPLTFNTANGNAISVSDLDAASGSVQVSLTVTNGTLTLGSTAGLTVTSGANGSATMTFTGTISSVNTALQGLRYDPTADYSGAAVVTIVTNDQGNSGSGGALSDTDTVNITVNNVNDAPVLAGTSAIGYTENQAPAAVAPSITVSDVDSANLTGATVTISGNFNASQDVLAMPPAAGAITAVYNAGVLTLSGTDTVASYQAALRSVTYVNTSDAPSTAARGIDIVVTDGSASSNTASVQVNITATNDAAVVTAGATLSYTENQAATAIDTTLTVADVDSANLASATVQITGNYQNGQDLLTFADTATITASFDATTGKLTLTGSDTVANWQAALRAVKYSNNSENPNTGARTVTWIVNDGAANSTPVTSTINVAAANDAPTVTPSANLAYTEGQGAVVLDAGVTVADPDSTQISGATVQITGNYASGQDVLAFATIGSISGSFNAASGTLTLTGTDTVANYQAALRTVTYTNTSNAPSALTRTITWNATDASAGTGAGLTSTITVTSINTAPTVTTTNTVNYPENAAPRNLEPTLAITDPDSATLTGATISITANYASGQDVLSFTGNGTITGSFNAATGVLTLSGTDTVMNYEMVLRSVAYANTSDDPATLSRTTTWVVTDGTDASTAKTTTINVTAANDAPVVTVAPSTSYTEDAPPVVLSNGMTVTDADNANMTGATVSITANFASAEDVLTATASGNVTVGYNNATGVLTLSGTDTVAVYQAVLRTVAYSNSSQNPSALTRSVSWSVNDGTANGTAASTVAVVNVNDAPAITAGGTLNFTENGAAAAIDGTITISDADSANLTGATVTIGNFAGAEDVLAFATIGAISGSYNAGTGVLTLTGTDTVANYQAALRTVTYRNTSENPSTTSRSISWVVNDGTAASNTATSSVNVSATNDAPVVATAGTASYTEDSAPVVASSTITVSDVDSNIASATVAITANFVSAEDVLAFATIGSITGSYNSTTGVLTLTGAGTPAEYQAALRSVTYSNPSQNPTATTRTLTWNVNDGTVSSAGTTSTLAVVNVNDAPILTAGGTLAYTENAPATAIDTTITVSDVDSGNLTGATVSISAGFQSGADVLAVATQNGISGSYNAATGVLTLSGASTVANYQTALRSVTYTNTSENPTATRTISWVATDGTTPSSAVTSTINLTAVNDAPTLTAGATLSYTENQAATAIDATVTVSDIDSTNLTGATVQITGNYQNGQDVLSFVTIGAISGSFDATSGTLTLTGSDTVANYQAALRTVKYNNTSESPITTARTVTWTVTDGVMNSNQPTSTITVVAVDDAPVVTAGATLAYTENDAASVIDNTVTVTDADSANITGATVSISANFQSGADVLSFATIGAISGSYNAATGVLTLTGTDTVANYQAALRTVKFNNTSETPSTAARTISFVVTDGTNPSSGATSTINVTAVNDAPVNTVPGAQTTLEDTNRIFSSGNGNQISISDPDGDVTVQVTLTATNGTLSTNAIVGLTFTTGDGTDDATMTFTGTVSTINARLNGLTFKPNLNYYSGSPTTDVITITTNDQGNTGSGGALQDVDTIAVDVDPVNDAPVAASYTVANGSPHITASGIGITISAADSNDLKEDATDVDQHDPHSELTVQIVGGTLSPANASLTLIDASTGAFYFEPPGGLSGSGAASFQYQVCDNGDVSLGLAAQCSAPATVQFTITGTDTWFVDDTDAAGCGAACNGSRTKPLVGLNNAALATRGTGDRVFVFSGTYNHGFTMAASERLIGQAATGTFDVHFGVAVPGNGTLDSRPPTSGAAVTLQNTLTAANNTLLRGISITTAANKGYVSTAGNTTLTVLESSVSSTGNMAIDVTGATNAATSVAFTSTSSGSGTRGISLDGVNGTWSLGGGALSNNTAAAFYLQNANAANITYSGNIAPTGTGRAVQIGTSDGVSGTNVSNGLEAGSVVTLSGNLTAGGVAVYESVGGTLNLTGTTHTFNTGTVSAVDLVDNDGTTLNFNGGNLTITTTSGKGFSATQGGTVNVIGANNVINVTAGTSAANTRALEITGALAARMAGTQSWKSISQSGGDRGISVSFFDGPVTVAGTGVAGSGGTIQSINNRGAEFINVLNGASTAVSLTNMNFTNASTVDLADASAVNGTCGISTNPSGSNSGCGAALHLATVKNVVLTSLAFTGTMVQQGINGFEVDGLSLTNVSVAAAGNEVGEHGINLQKVNNTITFNNVDTTGGFNRNFQIIQPAAATATLTVSNGSTFNNAGAQGVLFQVGGGGVLTANIQSGTTFNNNYSFGLNGAVEVSGASVLNLNVDGAIFNASLGGPVVQASGGTLNYSFTNNQVINSTGSNGITITSDNAGVAGGTLLSQRLIQGNSVTGNSAAGAGIAINNSHSSRVRANIVGNTITGGGGNGINAGATATGKVELVVTGNLIGSPSAVASQNQEAILMDSGAGVAGEAPCLTLQLGGSVTPGAWPSTAANAKNRIEGDWKIAGGGFEVFLSQNSASSVFNLVGLPAPAPNADAFVAANNSITSTNGVNVITSAVGNFTNATSCP